METAMQTAGMLVLAIGVWIGLVLTVFSVGPFGFALALVIAGIGLYSYPKITISSFVIVAITAMLFLHIL